MLSAGNSGILRGCDVHIIFLGEVFAVCRGGDIYSDWDISDTLMKGEYIMKIVVVKSPKLFAGILRLMFGIKKPAVEQ